MVYYLWKMYTELTYVGADMASRYSHLPTFVLSVFLATVFGIICAVITAIFEKKLNPLRTGRIEIATLAFLLAPFPLLVSLLGFVYVIAYSGALWGS